MYINICTYNCFLLQMLYYIVFFSGVGVAMFIVSCSIAVYYNVVISWSVFYVVNSLRTDVPWKSCNVDWATGSMLLKLIYYSIKSHNAKPSIFQIALYLVVN